MQQALRLLGAVRIEPLLAKGWAAAKLYPEPGLRPYDDIDLLVRPQQYALAAAVLGRDIHWNKVDLHTHFAELVDRSLDDLYSHAMVVPMDGVEIRILGPEDHLRLLCQHLLRHGIWRPGWLCDIGAALESLPNGFDWEYCLSGDPRRSEWVQCAIALAHELLGARTASRVSFPNQSLPRWLISAVLKEWGRREAHRSPGPLSAIWRLPFNSRVLQELRCRWPNPIVATVFFGASFDEMPRLPMQLANYLVSAALAAAGRSPTGRHTIYDVYHGRSGFPRNVGSTLWGDGKSK